MVSIAISVCTGMFFPYSKNVGAEFVSKIDLASTTPTRHVHSMMLHTYVHHITMTTPHVRTYVTVQNNYNGKVPDIAPLQCIRYVPPSVGLRTCTLLLCHLWSFSAQSLALQNKPNHFLDQSRPTWLLPLVVTIKFAVKQISKL
jgi:hypothetical protein